MAAPRATRAASARYAPPGTTREISSGVRPRSAERSSRSTASSSGEGAPEGASSTATDARGFCAGAAAREAAERGNGWRDPRGGHRERDGRACRRGVGHGVGEDHRVAERRRTHRGELLGDAARGPATILGRRGGGHRLARPARHRGGGDAANRLLAVVEGAGQRRLRGGGGAPGERQRGRPGHAAVTIGERRTQRLLGARSTGESEQQHGTAPHERARVTERREQSRLGALAGQRNHGVERGAPHHRARVGELASSHVDCGRTGQRAERGEQRHLHLGVPLAPHRCGDERRGGPGAHDPQRVGGTPSGARVGGGEVVHGGLVERPLGAALEPVLQPDRLGPRQADSPGGLEALCDLAHAGVRPERHDRRLLEPQPGRLGGQLPRSKPLDLGAQLGDEAGQVGLLSGRLARRGSAGDAGLVDEAGEEALALPLQQPDPLRELLIAATQGVEVAPGPGQLGQRSRLARAGGGRRLLLSRRHLTRSR